MRNFLRDAHKRTPRSVGHGPWLTVRGSQTVDRNRIEFLSMSMYIVGRAERRFVSEHLDFFREVAISDFALAEDFVEASGSEEEDMGDVCVIGNCESQANSSRDAEDGVESDLPVSQQLERGSDGDEGEEEVDGDSAKIAEDCESHRGLDEDEAKGAENKEEAVAVGKVSPGSTKQENAVQQELGEEKALVVEIRLVREASREFREEADGEGEETDEDEIGLDKAKVNAQ